MPRLVLLAGLLSLTAAPLAVAETRGFVVSYFYPATYFGADTCPKGMNPLPDVFFRRDLKILGLPQADVDRMFTQDYNKQNEAPVTNWVAVAATRGNGRDSVYVHPTTVPDAHLNPAVGRFGYGFNLDGRGAASPNSYEDPETHEKGVNNALFRTLGCFQVYKANPPPQPPLEAEYRWHSSRPMMGAWLIAVSGEDLRRDGPVTVTLQTSIDPVTEQDANAQVQRDLTYRGARHPTAVNVLQGRLTNGVIVTAPADLEMVCDSYIQPRFSFHRARLRLKLNDDGTMSGVLGGYQPWYPIYWSHAKVGYIDERGFGVDVPALYYALRRNADAYPDSVTGENTEISSAYALAAVPAFIVAAEARPEHVAAQTASDSVCEKVTACSRLLSLVRDALAPQEPEVSGAPAVARRLTPDQYRQVVSDVFGPAIAVEGRFEPGLRDDGLLAVGYAHVGITSSGLEQYDAMARGIAAQVVNAENRTTYIPCSPASSSDADARCARRFFEDAGGFLLRRPLSPDELDLFVKLANETAHTLQNFYSGLEMSLAALLVSPQFLFHQEVVEPDPDYPGRFRLDSFSKASQLSFLLWNAGPDRQLREAARNGSLQTADGLRREVDRMLASPRLETGIRAFFTDMLQFELFDTLAKDAKIYPKWTARVGEEAQEQTLRSIVDVVLTQHGDYRDLFTSRRTFLTPLLGSIYDVPVAQGSEHWQAHTYGPDDPHQGVLAQASFVALHAHEGLSSPTLRGKALRELLLCEPVPAPPGNVNFAVAQDTHNADLKTMRDRLSAHRTDPTCAGCHKLMDPMGFALEAFDADGSYRTRENDVLIDTSGELDGVEFSDAAGLGRAMHDDPVTAACLVRRVFSYATGRGATRPDMPWIRYLEKSFAEEHYRMPELLRRIALGRNLYRVASPAMPASQVAALATAEERP